jgi:hypothetical protein
MSQENVEVIRRGVEAWNLHDADLWLSYAAPELPGVRGPRPRRLGALAGVKMKGGTSHVELDQEFAFHAVLRNGKVTAVRSFLAWEEAVEALRLWE